MSGFGCMWNSIIAPDKGSACRNVLNFTKYALDYNIEDINTDMHHICIYRYAPISKIHASISSNKCLIYSIHPREYPFIEETTAWI